MALLGFGTATPKRVTYEQAEYVDANGNVGVSADTGATAAGAAPNVVPVRSTGESQVQAGDVVPVFWTRKNLAPGHRGVGPAKVIKHEAARVQPPSAPSRLVTEGIIEGLFVGPGASGTSDVWYWNASIIRSLNIRGKLPKDPEWVQWGEDGKTFLVRSSQHVYHVFRISGNPDARNGRQTPAATFVTSLNLGASGLVIQAFGHSDTFTQPTMLIVGSLYGSDPYGMTIEKQHVSDKTSHNSWQRVITLGNFLLSTYPGFVGSPNVTSFEIALSGERVVMTIVVDWGPMAPVVSSAMGDSLADFEPTVKLIAPAPQTDPTTNPSGYEIVPLFDQHTSDFEGQANTPLPPGPHVYVIDATAGSVLLRSAPANFQTGGSNVAGEMFIHSQSGGYTDTTFLVGDGTHNPVFSVDGLVVQTNLPDPGDTGTLTCTELLSDIDGAVAGWVSLHPYTGLYDSTVVTDIDGPVAFWDVPMVDVLDSGPIYGAAVGSPPYTPCALVFPAGRPGGPLPQDPGYWNPVAGLTSPLVGFSVPFTDIDVARRFVANGQVHDSAESDGNTRLKLDGPPGVQLPPFNMNAPSGVGYPSGYFAAECYVRIHEPGGTGTLHVYSPKYSIQGAHVLKIGKPGDPSTMRILLHVHRATFFTVPLTPSTELTLVLDEAWGGIASTPSATMDSTVEGAIFLINGAGALVKTVVDWTNRVPFNFTAGVMRDHAGDTHVIVEGVEPDPLFTGKISIISLEKDWTKTLDSIVEPSGFFGGWWSNQIVFLDPDGAWVRAPAAQAVNGVVKLGAPQFLNLWSPDGATPSDKLPIDPKKPVPVASNMTTSVGLATTPATLAPVAPSGLSVVATPGPPGYFFGTGTILHTVVTAWTASGESKPSNDVVVIGTDIDTPMSYKYTWSRVPNAAGYSVYQSFDFGPPLEWSEAAFVPAGEPAFSLGQGFTPSAEPRRGVRIGSGLSPTDPTRPPQRTPVSWRLVNDRSVLGPRWRAR